jgi:hypothetical protein
MQSDSWELAGSIEKQAEQLAALGPPLGEFRLSEARFIRQLLLVPLLLLGGLVLVALPLLVFFFARGGGGDPALFKLLVLGCFLMIGAVVLVVRAWRNRGLCVLVYREGLVRLHREKANAFFWDEVDTVVARKNKEAWSKAAAGSLVVTVRRSNGEEYQFDDTLPDLKRLAEMIRTQTLQHLLPRALDAVQAGSEVTFGKLRVGPAGLSRERGREHDTLPWEQIKEIKIDDDKVTITKKGNWLTWHTVPLGEVPNAHVFGALVQKLLPPQKGEGGPDAS